jgi:hypothetical protein
MCEEVEYHYFGCGRKERAYQNLCREGILWRSFPMPPQA